MYNGYPNLGEMIRNLRLEREMSREQLAEAAGISRSHMNKIEIGINQLGYAALYRIMGVLDVEIRIREEEHTEKGKCALKPKDILMSRSEKEAKFMLKILKAMADNLDSVS